MPSKKVRQPFAVTKGYWGDFTFRSYLRGGTSGHRLPKTLWSRFASGDAERCGRSSFLHLLNKEI